VNFWLPSLRATVIVPSVVFSPPGLADVIVHCGAEGGRAWSGGETWPSFHRRAVS
jgi:hypothetical protein